MCMWVAFIIYHGSSKFGLLFAIFSCLRTFNMHNMHLHKGPPSWSPLSKNTRHFIHYARIGESFSSCDRAVRSLSINTQQWATPQLSGQKKPTVEYVYWMWLNPWCNFHHTAEPLSTCVILEDGCVSCLCLFYWLLKAEGDKNNTKTVTEETTAEEAEREYLFSNFLPLFESK